MFKHHKFCVIEVSGVLVALAGQSGALDMYLIDGPDELKAGDTSRGIRIADQSLLEFVCQNASDCDGSMYQYRLDARITGTIDLDSTPAQLLSASQAIMSDKGRELRYQADI